MFCRTWVKQFFRPADCYARLERGEFAVMVNDLPREGAYRTLPRKIDRLFEALGGKPFTVGKVEIAFTTVVGINLFSGSSVLPGTLLQQAVDTAEKLSGKGAQYEFYDHKITTQAKATLKLESDLRQAIAHEELVVYYQAKVDLKTGKIIGMEALVRWEHPEQGFISPEVFIKHAEETGLIVPLGEWVLRTACKDTAQWVKKDGQKALKVAVNLSGVQLVRKDIVQTVQCILDETGLSAKNLELEITESSATSDMDDAIDKLSQFRSLGMGISTAMDDFGTGYSSLALLKQFPLNTLKVDQAFLRGDEVDLISKDSKDLAVVKAIIAMALGLTLEIVAEGIESKEVGELLQKQGAQIGQGYYFSKPVPASEFGRLLQIGILPEK